MEFKLKLTGIKLDDILRKSVNDIFLDVLDYIYDVARYKHKTKDEFKAKESYWDYSEVYDCFEGILKCIALNVSNMDYIIEDLELEVQVKYKYEDVFDLPYEEFYKKIMLIISDSLQTSFSLTDENLVEAFKLFTDSVSDAVGFLEVHDATDYLVSSKLTKSQFRDLLPEIARSDFDKFVQDYESMGNGRDFDSSQDCRESVVESLFMESLYSIKDYTIDLIGISNQLKEG